MRIWFTGLCTSTSRWQVHSAINSARYVFALDNCCVFKSFKVPNIPSTFHWQQRYLLYKAKNARYKNRSTFSNHFSSAFSAMPPVLWRCWLGGRKGIWPVKKLSGGVLACLSVWSEVQTCIRPSWCHCHSLSLASVKSRLALLFWYRLTRVVPDEGQLNVCTYVCSVLFSSRAVNQASTFLFHKCTRACTREKRQQSVAELMRKFAASRCI